MQRKSSGQQLGRGDYKRANPAQACDLIDNTDWNNLLFEDDVNITTLICHRCFLEIMQLYSYYRNHTTSPGRMRALRGASANAI